MSTVPFDLRVVYVLVPSRRRPGAWYAVVRIDPRIGEAEVVQIVRRYPGYGLTPRRRAKDEITGYTSDYRREGRERYAAVVVYHHSSEPPAAELLLEDAGLDRQITARTEEQAAGLRRKAVRLGADDEYAADCLARAAALQADAHAGRERAAAEDAAKTTWLADHAADVARWHAAAVAAAV